MSATPTHALLLQFAQPGADDAAQAARAAQAVIARSLAGAALQRTAHQPEAGCYAYYGLSDPVPLDACAAAQLEAALRTSGEVALAHCQVSRLQLVMHREGPAATARAPVHYVVEMDPEDGWRDELFRWYDEEHLPGLASVPGTVRAQRYLNLDHGPLSLACYDLIDASVMGCPDWLAVRATDWSARVRPHFTNTKRTMFSTLE